MLDSLILNKRSIENIYRTICEYHEKYLKQFGVKLPKLYASKKKFTKDALVLVYLAYDYPKTRKVSKEELTKFVRSYYPNTNDVQQARHLGAQAGWWIVAGGRDNIVLKMINVWYFFPPALRKCKLLAIFLPTADFLKIIDKCRDNHHVAALFAPRIFH